MSKRTKLERRVVAIAETGHGICAEAFASRVIYRGPHRISLCAHSETDVRATVLPVPAEDRRAEMYAVVRDSIEEMQRALGAER